MKRENQTPLTLLEACTLVAREAVSLLEGGEEALDSGIKFRETLALLHSSQDLGDGGALLAWVDHELEHAKRFAKTGERINSLVRLTVPAEGRSHCGAALPLFPHCPPRRRPTLPPQALRRGDTPPLTRARPAGPCAERTRSRARSPGAPQIGPVEKGAG